MLDNGQALAWGLIIFVLGLVAWLKRDALANTTIRMMGERTDRTETLGRFQARFIAGFLLITGSALLLSTVLGS